LPLVCTFEDVLRCGVEACECFPQGRGLPVKCGKRVLIWGDHFGASDAAEKLAADGKKVYVVTENREFAQWLEPCHRDVMLKRFAGGNGEGLKGKRLDQPVSIIAGTTVTAIGEDGHVKLLDHSFHQSGLTVDNVGLTLDEDLMLNANRAPVSRLPAEVRVKG
jgi:thioredoxin reductase